MTFEVAAGEFCVILGPSGSGKSTLLRTLNGLVTADSGSIRIGEIEITAHSLPKLRRQVGMIYQQFSLVQRASVAHNVISGVLASTNTLQAILGIFSQTHRRKACNLLSSVGLQPEHLRRRVDELSGGQQQRVGIARAFMSDPSLILADEPVASLDPKISRDILSLLQRQARERNATVLCSLHQVDLAQEFGDRIIALRQGRVVFDGAPSCLTSAVETAIYENAPQLDSTEKANSKPLAEVVHEP